MNNIELIDISVPLSATIPTWPGGYGLRISKLMEISKGAEANVSKLDLDVHCGTHIDAPLHFIEKGKTTDEIELSRLLGNCFIAEFSNSVDTIYAKDFEELSIPEGISRLLLKTLNSSQNLWDNSVFYKDFCAISPCAAEWLVKKKIDLVGIDYCSIQKFNDPSTVHQILLKNEIIILEGLDLRKVNQGTYELICLPIKVSGVEGIPVRAILKQK